MMSLNNVDDNLSITNETIIRTRLASFCQQLKIGHINCQSMRPSSNCSKFDELRSLVSDHFDIIAVSETWLKPYISDSSVRLADYKLIRNDRPHRRGGGVCIYLHRGISYRVVMKTSSPDCESIFIDVLFRNVRVLFGVVYLPHGNLTVFEDQHFELLVRHSNIITVGDFNCNMFNIVKSNLVRSLCTRSGLSLYHNSRPTHVSVAHGSTSLIDFWLVSDHSIVLFSDQVYCPSLSHHSLIFAAFRFDYQRSCEFIEYRNFNSIDWYSLLDFLYEYDMSSFFESPDVDSQNSILNSLITALYSFVPVVRKRIASNCDNWMRSCTIVLAVSLRDLAYSAYLARRSNENWAIYCRYRNRAKSVIRKEKRKFYTRMFSGLDVSGMWKVLKGSGYSGGSEWDCQLDANVMNEFFVNAPGSNDGPVDIDFLDDMDESFSFHCVDEHDLFLALGKVKSGALGVDNIPVRFLKLIYPYVSSILTFHVNTILCSSCFPSAWKIGRVVPLPKVRNVRGVEDLRPISILPALSKAVEHIMKDQMLLFVRRSLVPTQYAFRRGHNTTSLLLDLTDDVRSVLNNSGVATILSLDLSKAFNSVNFRVLIRKLKECFGFSVTACKLIYSYLFDRYQYVATNNQSSELLRLATGVPQGSVLGPILFVLYMNDLSAHVESLDCKSFLFADDVFLLFRGNRLSLDMYRSNINGTLRRFVLWSSENCLSVNMSKTKALTFGVSNLLLDSFDIDIGSSKVDSVDSMRCLGIVLDSRLSFMCHIEHLSCKVSGLIRRFYSANLYLPLQIKLRLAHALLMPQVLYGLEVFSGSNVSVLSTLRRTVNTIVRFVYGSSRRDHISGFVQRFLGCSFDDYIKLRNLYFFYRVIKNGFPVKLYSRFNFSHSSRSTQILIPLINNSLFEKSFTVRIARNWNRLPMELRLFSHSNNVFRLKLIRYLNGNHY